MKFIITTVLFLIGTSTAFASMNEGELDQVCAPTASIYARAVARLQSPQAQVTRIKLIQNGYADEPSNSNQVWNVNLSAKGSFVTSVIVHTYWSNSGSCEVSKIIPNAVQ